MWGEESLRKKGPKANIVFARCQFINLSLKTNKQTNKNPDHRNRGKKFPILFCKGKGYLA